MLSLTFLLMTIVLVLYLYYRNEPEIKATSVSISLCMFLGSYLCLSYPLLVVTESHLASLENETGDILCQFKLWFNGVALPTSLILVTIFAKMLRVYTIFQDPFRAAKRKKLLSDKFVLVCIALILTPNFLVLTFVAIFDPLKNEAFHIVHRSHTELINRCTNNNIEILIIVLATYIILLCLAVLILAIKSNRIGYKHFKDTKHTNAFVFVIESLVFLSLIYWVFFRKQERSITNQRVSESIVCCAGIMIPMACQILLFIPKVHAPLKRHYYR